MLGRVRQRIYAAVVAMATLTGPASSFVTPLFLWKAWRTRSRAAIVVAVVSSVCAAVQVVYVWQGGMLSGPDRAHGLSIVVVAAVALMRTVVLPVLGSDAALAFSRHVQLRPGVVGTHVVPPAVFTVLLLGTLVLIIVALAYGVRREVRWRLAGSYALVTAGTMMGAFGDLRVMLSGVEASARYAFVPGVLVLWLLVLNVHRFRSVSSLVCAALLAYGLGSAALHWRETLRWKASWPQWRAEVVTWERDQRAPLRIWPRGWTMRLVPRPPAPSRAEATAPCESIPA